MELNSVTVYILNRIADDQSDLESNNRKKFINLDGRLLLIFLK